MALPRACSGPARSSPSCSHLHWDSDTASKDRLRASLVSTPQGARPVLQVPRLDTTGLLPRSLTLRSLVLKPPLASRRRKARVTASGGPASPGLPRSSPATRLRPCRDSIRSRASEDTAEAESPKPAASHQLTHLGVGSLWALPTDPTV